MAGEWIQRDVGHDAQAGEFLLERLHHPWHQAGRIERFAAVGRFEGCIDDRKQGHHRYAQCDALLRHRHQQVKAQTFNAGHGCNSFAAFFSIEHKDGVDQIMRRQRVFTNQVASEFITPQTPGAANGKGGGNVHDQNCA